MTSTVPFAMLLHTPRDAVSAHDLQMPVQARLAADALFAEVGEAFVLVDADRAIRLEAAETARANGRRRAVGVRHARRLAGRRAAAIREAGHRAGRDAGAGAVAGRQRREEVGRGGTGRGQAGRARRVPLAGAASHLPLVPQVDGVGWSAHSAAGIGRSSGDVRADAGRAGRARLARGVAGGVAADALRAERAACTRRPPSTRRRCSLSPHELAAQVNGVTHWLLLVQALKQRVPLQMYGLHGHADRAPRTGRWRCRSTAACRGCRRGCSSPRRTACRPASSGSRRCRRTCRWWSRSTAHHRAHAAQIGVAGGDRRAAPERGGQRAATARAAARLIAADPVDAVVVFAFARAWHICPSCFSPQVLSTQAMPGAQSAAVVQHGRARAVRAAERIAVLDALRPAGAEAVAGAGVLRRVPEQVGAMHCVSRAYFEQLPMPSHLPSVPQVDAPLSWQMPRGSGLSASTGQQVPSRPIRLQERHGPWQATLQQTPSAQKFEAHCSSRSQVAPFIACRSSRPRIAGR